MDQDYTFVPEIDTPVFISPNDINISIWRYMDFTKFLAMLENSGLFFARADTLGDPFEGSYSLPVHLDPTVDSPIQTPDFLDYLHSKQSEMQDLSKWAVSWMFINCWHMNEHESAAMWQLYSQSNNAIAVQATYSRLHNFLNGSPFLGKVTYIDFQTERTPVGSRFYPFMHKRKSFEHEREVRAIIHRLPDGRIDTSQKPEYKGIGVDGDLNNLIERIYVSPMADTWFKELIEKVLERYGLRFQVVQSSLNDDPVY